MVTTRRRAARGRFAPSDVCLLFRRFIAYQDDVTRSYVEALESRGVPHLLVGGKTFHEREEVDALRTALAAIEWPDDELSVFATLRGPLFAIGDEELLEYHARCGSVARTRVSIPIDVPDALPPHLAPIGEALGVAARAACRPQPSPGGRHHRPADRSDARARGFMLWRGGEQVLANVLHIARAGAPVRERRRAVVPRLRRDAARCRGGPRAGAGSADSSKKAARACA